MHAFLCILFLRYPSSDNPEFPLPGSVPLFCLPFGVSVEHWDRHTPFPLPSFSTFALTNAQGQCVSDHVLSIYTPNSSCSLCSTELGTLPCIAITPAVVCKTPNNTHKYMYSHYCTINDNVPVLFNHNTHSLTHSHTLS